MMTALLAVSADADWLGRLERAAGGAGLEFSRLRDARVLSARAGAAGVVVADSGPEAPRWARAVRRDLPGYVLAFAVAREGLAAGAVSEALARGADGILDKDGSEAVLAARLRELGRRAAAAARERGLTSPDGRVRLQPAGGRVFLRRRGAWKPGPALSVREAGLLRLLLERPGRVFERADLLEALWRGRGGDVNSEALDKQAASLRRKLGPAGRSLRTVRGRGYCWG
ncbi:MAG: winged helix-turn-helix domain-containing protein [Elusimicrobia bacterium]|nr:winged helix-turn-helix domain-containing protein [Elusimicrobiota bacterium]